MGEHIPSGTAPDELLGAVAIPLTEAEPHAPLLNATFFGSLDTALK